ncbi:MAG: hypothetical protein COB66_05200 [Coxiella sp. (in: Bacteria)]|nr:MAG: hypothetical protein COB66_05200 [Coxiella sp. (in: g-proteobacteria)]
MFRKPLLIALPVILVVVIYSSLFGRPYRYDVFDADYHWITRQIDEATEAISSDHPLDDLNFENISDPNWTTICLFNGYTDPQVHMAELGYHVTAFQRLSLDTKIGLYRVSTVDEHEAMIVIVGDDGRLRFIHLPNGYPLIVQHEENCFDNE